MPTLEDGAPARTKTFDEELLTHGSAACARLGDEPAAVRGADSSASVRPRPSSDAASMLWPA